MSKIRSAFENGKAFIPFITCGDPNLETTAKIVREAVANGADLIELGIPFSDPTAEGPVIQGANIKALAAGVTTDKVFDLVRDLRKDVTIPMVFMTYANVVYSYGAEKFISTCKEIGIDGLILTKLDGDTRGGAALSARAVTGKPIKFVGVGEKLKDLDVFHPDRMASRILGMGDMLSLIEKAENTLNEKKAEELEKKLRANKLDLNDMLMQFEEMKKMGPMKDILSMIPGLGKKLKDTDVDDRQIDYTMAIIRSMTLKERANPDIINPSRKRRIAAGCGMQVEDVNRLLNQYRQMQKIYKQLNGKSSKKMMKRMQRMGNVPGMGNMGGMGGFPM